MYPSEAMRIVRALGGILDCEAQDPFHKIYTKAIDLRKIISLDKIAGVARASCGWDNATRVILPVGDMCTLNISYDDLLELWRAARRNEIGETPT